MSVTVTPDSTVLIVGAGPAGLTAAVDLAKEGVRPTVFEMSSKLGGISRTEERDGYRFDIGGHRFFTKVGEVAAWWKDVGGDDFIKVPRKSRIFYRDKFYDYPLRIPNTLKNLGPYESLRILLSYFKWKVKPSGVEDNFEQWVSNRFGGRLYWHFFRTYTEKVWGIPCTQIRADWAAQRIKNLSFSKAIITALTGSNDTTSLITTFDYPRLGPGQMWERAAERVADGGGQVKTKHAVKAIHHDGHGHVTHVTVEHDGQQEKLACDAVINSMPISTLMHRLDPPPPQDVLDAAAGLRYRDFLIVCLRAEAEEPFDDNWIYIHSPKVQVGRIQNFKRWSAAMVPDPKMASLGMEYFCHQGDGLWDSSDEDLITLATREISQLGLVDAKDIRGGTVVRQPKAYPVYDENYKVCVDRLAEHMKTFDNLQTVGRNGMHRYNNQDHSMLTAMLAVRNLLGEAHDIWNVNVERSYHEEVTTKEKPGNVKEATERLTPHDRAKAAADRDLDELAAIDPTPPPTPAPSSVRQPAEAS